MSEITCNANLFELVSRCAAKDNNEFTLMGVRVEAAPNGLPGIVMVATDKHRLLCSYDDKGTLEGEPVTIRTRTRIDSHLVKACRDTRGIVGTLSVKTTYRNVDEMEWEVSRNDQTIKGIGSAANDWYPDYRRAIPDPAGWPKDERGTVPAFDPDYLSDFAKIAVDYDKIMDKGAELAIQSCDHATPALIRFGTSSDLIGVLMPRRPVPYGEQKAYQAGLKALPGFLAYGQPLAGAA